MELTAIHALRLRNWRQTPDTKLPDHEAAPEFIDHLGLVTLFDASPEVPNLYHAHMGDPHAKTDSSHDSPAGDVYTWRWKLGWKAVALYSTLVRGRPTYVSWQLLPAVLRLWRDARPPGEIYRAGELSQDAWRVAKALEDAQGTLSTGDLRVAAGFPTGKEHRAAYLKAVEELESRMLLAKVFSSDEKDMGMYHSLVSFRYPDHVAAAEKLTRDTAVDQLLAAYLPNAVYALPKLLSKHLRLPEAEVIAGLSRVGAQPVALPGQKDACYVTEGAFP
jgi:hypothetical protein